MEAARAVVTFDNGTHILAGKTTLGAENDMAVFHQPQQIGIVVRRNTRRTFGCFSQPRQVGDTLVEALVPEAVRLIRVPLDLLTDAGKVFLDFLGRVILSFLLVLALLDHLRGAVVDYAAHAVPLALGRIFGIHGGLDTSEMKGIGTSIAAKQVTASVTLGAVVTVLGWITVDR